MNEIYEWMAQLEEKDHKLACGAAKQLVAASENSSEVYAYFDQFIGMMSDENSYIRNRGLSLFAANAKWDTENKVDENIDAYLKHVADPKPITARQCIKALPQIVAAKPKLYLRVKQVLLKANGAKYPESMRNLVNKDIAWALKEIERNQTKKNNE